MQLKQTKRIQKKVYIKKGKHKSLYEFEISQVKEPRSKVEISP